MNSYKVYVTEYALSQMEQITDYISHTLLSPTAARNLLDKLKKEISSLDSMPLRYPLVDKEPWHSQKVRFFSVNNFVIYYYVDIDCSQVWIIAVVFGKREQLSALNDIPM